MKLAFFLFVVYAVLVSACYFPLNDYNANITEIKQLIADSVLDPASGWMTEIELGGKSPRQPWPHWQGQKWTAIRYCFRHQEDKQGLEDIVKRGWQLWQAKIGGAQQSTGHAFNGFIEYSNGHNEHPTCYVEGSSDWNKDVPSGTLMIVMNPAEAGSEAVVGYRDETISDAPDRHVMRIAKRPTADEPWDTLIVAHEMGHIMGLLHEHQRRDRDLYAHYDCTKLRDYEYFKSVVDQVPESGTTMEEICKSASLGFFVGWELPAAYSIEHTSDNGHENNQAGSKTYDFGSVMHYPSNGFAEKKDGGVADLPLVRWKNGPPTDGWKPNDQNAEIIPRPSAITDLDAAGIKFLYPWV